MMTPEGRVKQKLKQLFAAEPAYLFWPVQTGYGATTLDCLAVRWPSGKFIGIECKRRGVEKPTPRQAEVMRRIRAAGGETWLVTLDDNEELKWIQIND